MRRRQAVTHLKHVERILNNNNWFYRDEPWYKQTVQTKLNYVLNEMYFYQSAKCSNGSTVAGSPLHTCMVWLCYIRIENNVCIPFCSSVLRLCFSEKRPWMICTVCGATVKGGKARMRLHMIKHSDNEFSCQLCDYKTSYKRTFEVVLSANHCCVLHVLGHQCICITQLAKLLNLQSVQGSCIYLIGPHDSAS